MSPRLQSIIVNNVLWFLASLTIAILVWFVATIEVDPINQEPYARIEIKIEVDDGIIISSQSSQTARVIVRAQQSTIDLLQQDDITVKVNLEGKGEGTYTVPLEVEIARSGLASADTRPAQITVVLEQEVAQQIPIAVDIIPPSINFTYDAPSYDVFQAEVRGASSDVNQVVQLVAEIDLSKQNAESLVETQVQLVPVNADGNTVPDVTITPRQINVAVDVKERDDAHEFVVRPDIQFDTLPQNFEFRSVSTDPDEIIISGSPEVLAELGDTIRTIPISLEGRTADFTVEVPLDLPEDAGLVPLSGSGTIIVEISISEQTTTVPLENIPITVIGLSNGTTAKVAPEAISIFLNGPVSLIDGVTAQEVQAVIDANGLEAGTYDLVPQLIIRSGQVSLPGEDITLLPARVNVVISTPQPEATVEATSELGD